MRFALVALLLLAACGDDNEGGGGGGNPAAPSGADPFDDNVLATYEFSMAPSEWTAMVGNLQDNTWRRATLVWRGETYADVAVHPAGQSSREPGVGNPDKPSLWVSFDEFVPGREFHGFERIKLDSMVDDPAMVRERLVYPIYAARGVPAPRVAHARVVVNGTYRGLYLVEERVNKEFLTKRFGPTVNQLYRWTEMEADLSWFGPNPSRYVPNMWEPRIESLPPDAEGIQTFIDLLNNDPAQVGRVFDVDVFLNWMAVEVATAETDGYIGWYPGSTGFYTGNIFLTRNPATGKYTMIVWDRDQSFWRTEGITFGFDQRVLTRQLISSNAGNLARYRQFLRETVNGPALGSALQARFDFIRNQIQSAAFEDPFKSEPSNQDLMDEWTELRGFFELRRQQILQELGS